MKMQVEISFFKNGGGYSVLFNQNPIPPDSGDVVASINYESGDRQVLLEYLLAKAFEAGVEYGKGILNSGISEDEMTVDEEADKLALTGLFNRSIDDLGLSVRSYNCLEKAKFLIVGDIIQLSDKEIRRIKNLGEKSQEEIKTILANLGLSLGMRVEEWPENLTLSRPSGQRITRFSELKP